MGDNVFGFGVEVAVDKPDLGRALGEGDISKGAADLVVFDNGRDTGTLEEFTHQTGKR